MILKVNFFRVVFNSPILSDKIVDELIASIISVGKRIRVNRDGEVIPMNASQYIFLQIKIMIYIYNVAVISINWISRSLLIYGLLL